jgi:hypothetical protein
MLWLACHSELKKKVLLPEGTVLSFKKILTGIFCQNIMNCYYSVLIRNYNIYICIYHAHIRISIGQAEQAGEQGDQCVRMRMV